MESFKSWEWIFGRTPKFIATIPTYGLANLHLHIENGRIADFHCDQSFHEPCLTSLREVLINSSLNLVTFQNLAEKLQSRRVTYDSHFDTSALIRVMQHLCATNF